MIALVLSLCAFAQEVAEPQLDGGLEQFLAEQRAHWPDRSTPPAVAPATPWERLAPTSLGGDSGPEVLHQQVPGVRKVVVTLVRWASADDLGVDVAVLDALDLQPVATAHHHQLALEEALARIDASIGVSAPDERAGVVELVVPREHLAEGLALFNEVVAEPAFPKADLRRWLRNERFYWGQQLPTDAGDLAEEALFQAWFDPAHASGWRRTEQDFRKVDRDAVVDLASRLNQDTVPSSLFVVGDLGADELTALLAEHVPDVRGAHGSSAAQVDDPAPAPRASRFLAVNLPGAEQTQVRLRMAAPTDRSEDRAAFQALQWAYGGTFLSRLNRVLREEKGWTYGSSASYSGSGLDNQLTVRFDTAADTTADAIEQTFLVLDRLAAEGCSAEELDAAARERVADWNNAGLTAESASALYVDAALSDGFERVAERVRRAAELRPQDTAEVGKRWLSADRGRVWVVVGDRSKLEPELESLGWTWEWMSAEDVAAGLVEFR